MELSIAGHQYRYINIYVLSPWSLQGCLLYNILLAVLDIVSFRFILFRFVPFSLSLFVTYGGIFLLLLLLTPILPETYRDGKIGIVLRITFGRLLFVRRSEGGFFFLSSNSTSNPNGFLWYIATLSKQRDSEKCPFRDVEIFLNLLLSAHEKKPCLRKFTSTFSVLFNRPVKIIPWNQFSS